MLEKSGVVLQVEYLCYILISNYRDSRMQLARGERDGARRSESGGEEKKSPHCFRAGFSFEGEKLFYFVRFDLYPSASVLPFGAPL